jgi:hypothetical protein
MVSGTISTVLIAGRSWPPEVIRTDALACFTTVVVTGTGWNAAPVTGAGSLEEQAVATVRASDTSASGHHSVFPTRDDIRLKTEDTVPADGERNCGTYPRSRVFPWLSLSGFLV